MISRESPRPSAPFFAKGVSLFAFLILYIPLLILVALSFQGWTWDWYRKAFSNQQVLDALSVSLWIGFWTTLCSTLMGTGAALALERKRFPGRKTLSALVHVPLIMPEIVLGLSLLIWFVFLKLTLGIFSIVLAHITFSVSYVILTVQTRLQDFDETLEEAARDLGASAWQTFSKITLPLIWPGILSGALMAFTISFDDFLITFFTSGVSSDTFPLKIYSMIKFGVSPEINALSTTLLVVTFLFVLLFFKPFKRIKI